jgi:hypothetical protein
LFEVCSLALSYRIGFIQLVALQNPICPAKSGWAEAAPKLGVMKDGWRLDEEGGQMRKEAASAEDAERGKQHTRANKKELLWVELSRMTTKKKHT